MIARTIPAELAARRLDLSIAVLDGARCVAEHTPLTVFYPPAQTPGRVPPGGRPDPYAQARAVCARCPVREACADLGDRISDDQGMWGGLDPDQRRARRRARQEATRAR